MTFGFDLLLGTPGCYRSLLSAMFFISYLMTTIALLRKQTASGTSTWRFCTDSSTGSYFAIDPRSRRRSFRDFSQMSSAISNWRGYGYRDFDHTEPVRRGARQLIFDLAAVSA